MKNSNANLFDPIKLIRANCNKYSPKENYDFHADMLIEVLIYNKNSHYSSTYKDCMLYDYIDEFLKRYYTTIEAVDRVPKMAKYYTNYLTFFCKPTFRDFKVNCTLKSYGDNKAELYYLCHYGRRIRGHKDDSELSEKDELKELTKTLLTSVVREKINHNSMTEFDITIKSTNKNLVDFSIANNLTGHNLEDTCKSGLLTKRSQKEESLLNILFDLDPLNMDGILLVKDKVHFKKNMLISNLNGKNISSKDNLTNSVGNKTNKDRDKDRDKEKDILPIDLNIIEIKEHTGITDRESAKGRNINKPILEDSIRPESASPMKYSRLNEFKSLKVSYNHITNGSDGITLANLTKLANLTNLCVGNRTRNKGIVIQSNKGIQGMNTCITNNLGSQTGTTVYNSNKTYKKNESPIKTNNYLEKIQTDTLKALQKIKRTKLEFKSVSGSSSIPGTGVNSNTNTNNYNNPYANANANANANPNANDNANPNVNANEKLLKINCMLKLTVNDRSSRNRPMNDAKTDAKTDLRCSIRPNKSIKSINREREKEHNTSRKEKDDKKESKIFDNIAYNNTFNSPDAGYSTLYLHGMQKDRSISMPKSPNEQESDVHLNSCNLQKSMNDLKNMIEKTKTMSRNKHANASLLGMTSTIKTIKRNENNSILCNNLKSSKDKESVNDSNNGFAYKSFKSVKKDKSIITKTSFNLNLPSCKIEDLEKRIYGTFAGTLKNNINQFLSNKTKDNSLVKKQSVDSKTSKLIKTSNLIQSTHLFKIDNPIQNGKPQTVVTLPLNPTLKVKSNVVKIISVKTGNKKISSCDIQIKKVNSVNGGGPLFNFNSTVNGLKK